MPEIFINYRTTDAYAAVLLDERLSRLFGRNAVFRASRSIMAGRPYEEVLLQAIEHSDIMLVLIGKTWLAAVESGADVGWMRREVAEAIKCGVPTVPVLLTGVSNLDGASLPSDLADLARVQYLRFGYRTADEDAQRIGRDLHTLVPSLKGRRPSIWGRVLRRRWLRAI